VNIDVCEAELLSGVAMWDYEENTYAYITSNVFVY
jgi:hypothetical protein